MRTRYTIPGVFGGMRWHRYDFPYKGFFMSGSVGNDVKVSVSLTDPGHPDHQGVWLAIIDRSDEFATEDDFLHAMAALYSVEKDTPKGPWYPHDKLPHQQVVTIPKGMPGGGNTVYRTRWLAKQ